MLSAIVTDAYGSLERNLLFSTDCIFDRDRIYHI